MKPILLKFLFLVFAFHLYLEQEAIGKPLKNSKLEAVAQRDPLVSKCEIYFALDSKRRCIPHLFVFDQNSEEQKTQIKSLQKDSCFTRQISSCWYVQKSKSYIIESTSVLTPAHCENFAKSRPMQNDALTWCLGSISVNQNQNQNQNSQFQVSPEEHERKRKKFNRARWNVDFGWETQGFVTAGVGYRLLQEYRDALGGFGPVLSIRKPLHSLKSSTQFTYGVRLDVYYMAAGYAQALIEPSSGSPNIYSFEAGMGAAFFTAFLGHASDFKGENNTRVGLRVLIPIGLVL